MLYKCVLHVCTYLYMYMYVVNIIVIVQNTCLIFTQCAIKGLHTMHSLCMKERVLYSNLPVHSESVNMYTVHCMYLTNLPVHSESVNICTLYIHCMYEGEGIILLHSESVTHSLFVPVARASLTFSEC